MFCAHDWLVPAYNKALDLREGLKKCVKCGTVRGYPRHLGMDEDAEPNQVGSGGGALIGAIVTGGITLVFTSTAIGPIDTALNATADPLVDTAQRLAPLVAAIIVFMAALGFFTPSYTNDAEYDQDAAQGFVEGG